jgi:signal transduction histidine kinase
MLDSLRNRLILSHILPPLLVIPLLGIALLYALENQFFLPALTREMSKEATLFASVLAHHDEIWQDPKRAQEVVDQPGADSPGVIMLLAPDGELLASSSKTSQPYLDALVAVRGVSPSAPMRVSTSNYYDRQRKAQVLDVMAPVIGTEGELIGFVRIVRWRATLYEELLQLRYVIGGISIFGLLGAAVLGSVLALSIGQPLRRMKGALSSLVQGDYGEPLEVHNALVVRLHNLEEARRQLLANLVHELGRPLGAMDTAIQALLRGARDDPQLADELLAGLAESTARLQHLVEDLARLHDQVLGPLELNWQRITLAQWLPAVLRPWQEVARERGRQWHAEIAAGLPAVQGDPVRLAQAVSNLASNAVKFTPQGGVIVVSAGACEENGEIWIQVKDSGPGIPPEEQANVFEPLYRGSAERRIKQGMGLGLGIARDLIEAHGGRLELESSPGAGSCFTIWLPRQQNP